MKAVQAMLWFAVNQKTGGIAYDVASPTRSEAWASFLDGRFVYRDRIQARKAGWRMQKLLVTHLGPWG